MNRIVAEIMNKVYGKHFNYSDFDLKYISESLKDDICQECINDEVDCSTPLIDIALTNFIKEKQLSDKNKSYSDADILKIIEKFMEIEYPKCFNINDIPLEILNKLIAECSPLIGNQKGRIYRILNDYIDIKQQEEELIEDIEKNDDPESNVDIYDNDDEIIDEMDKYITSELDRQLQEFITSLGAKFGFKNLNLKLAMKSLENRIKYKELITIIEKDIAKIIIEEYGIDGIFDIHFTDIANEIIPKIIIKHPNKDVMINQLIFDVISEMRTSNDN